MKSLLVSAVLLVCLSSVAVFAMQVATCYNGCGICGFNEVNWSLLIPDNVVQECYYNSAIDQWYWWLNEDSTFNPGSAGAHSGAVNLYRTGIMGMGYEQSNPSTSCCTNDQTGVNRWIYEECTNTVGGCPGGLASVGGCYCDTITGFTGSCRTGTIQRTFSSYTPCSGTRLTLVQTITVVDRVAPYMGIPADVTIECLTDSSPLVTGFPYSYDRCDTAPPSISFADGALGGPTCNQNFRRVWTAADTCTHAVPTVNTQTQTITLSDTIPPTFTALPADTSFQCDALRTAAPAPTITATDLCNNAATTVTSSSVTIGKTCTNNYKFVTTYTANDGCGNTVSHVYTVTVADTLPPVISGIVDGAFISQACPPTALTVSSADNCDGTLTPTLLTTTIPVTGKFGVYDVQRRATVTDACGNTATAADTVRYSLTAAVTIIGGNTVTGVTAGTAYPLAVTIANPIAPVCTYNTGDFFIYFEPYPFQFTPLAGCDTRSSATGEVRCKLTLAQLTAATTLTLTAPTWLLTTGQTWKINVAIGSETYANTGSPIVTTFTLSG